MKFFVDTAEIEPIRDLAAHGPARGVTTQPFPDRPSRGGISWKFTREICGLVDGPVSAEVVALDHATMMKEAEVLRKIADNVCIKVPLTVDGLKTCKALNGRRHDGQCDAVFLGQSGAAGGQGGGQLHFRPSSGGMTTMALMGWI